MSKTITESIAQALTEVTKQLDRELADQEKAGAPAHERHAIKMWRGIVGRVARDLREFGK